MIRLHRDSSGSITLVGAPEGAVAYADLDWLADGPAESVCLAVLPDGQLVLPDGQSQSLPDAVDPDLAAARALMAISRDAASYVRHVPPSAIEVVGRGAVAAMVRSYAGVDAERVATGKPAAFVDTTGGQDAIVESCRRVEDLGLVVLAGQTAARRLELNLYPDVHVRGLTLVGAGTVEDGFLTEPTDEREARIETDALSSLRRVPSGSLVPAGSWFRIE